MKTGMLKRLPAWAIGLGGSFVITAALLLLLPLIRYTLFAGYLTPSQVDGVYVFSQGGIKEPIVIDANMHYAQELRVGSEVYRMNGKYSLNQGAYIVLKNGLYLRYDYWGGNPLITPVYRDFVTTHWSYAGALKVKLGDTGEGFKPFDNYIFKRRIEIMNRKHIIQFVITVGAVLVLYVLSYAPLDAYIETYLYKNGLEVGLPPVASYSRFHHPVRWLERNSSLFARLNSTYRSWWVLYFIP